MVERDDVAAMNARETADVMRIYDEAHKIAGDGRTWQEHNTESRQWIMRVESDEWRKSDREEERVRRGERGDIRGVRLKGRLLRCGTRNACDMSGGA